MRTDVQTKSGTPERVPSSVYWDQETYERELDRVFGKSWLFVGHDSMVPNNGDYVTNFIGDDAVILVRGADGRLRVLLNRCRHRGNKVCLYDRGNARSFRCSYHGWTYSTSGDLAAVPLLKEGYGEQFSREDFGLVATPHVAVYRGLVFASWNADVQRLEDYLGADLLWYLDNFLLDDPQGLEALPGRHRYLIPGNWKHLAENFGGDLYHFPATHASITALGKPREAEGEPVPKGRVGGFAMQQHELYSVTFAGGHPPHGLLMLAVSGELMDTDLREAARISPAAVDWVKARYARRAAAMASYPTQPRSFNNATIWPNLSMNGIGPALSGRSLFVWHPKGPELTEMRQWCFVDKSAPLEVKEHMSAVISVRQSATGMVSTDDVDNFQRMRDVMHSYKAKSVDFNYDLSRASDVETLSPSLPGRVGPAMTESFQRAFYQYWLESMAE